MPTRLDGETAPRLRHNAAAPTRTVSCETCGDYFEVSQNRYNANKSKRFYHCKAGHRQGSPGKPRRPGKLRRKAKR